MPGRSSRAPPSTKSFSTCATPKTASGTTTSSKTTPRTTRPTLRRSSAVGTPAIASAPSATSATRRRARATAEAATSSSSSCLGSAGSSISSGPTPASAARLARRARRASRSGVRRPSRSRQTRARPDPKMLKNKTVRTVIKKSFLMGRMRGILFNNCFLFKIKFVYFQFSVSHITRQI